ncbi:hypothetical protein [Ornithinimicrobium kibberense]
MPSAARRPRRSRAGRRRRAASCAGRCAGSQTVPCRYPGLGGRSAKRR